MKTRSFINVALAAVAALAGSAAASVASAAALPACPPDGTYTYVLNAGAQKFGDSSIVVKHDAVSVSLHEVEAVATGQRTSDETVEPVMLTPTSYAETFPINPSVTVTAHYTFDPGGAKLSVDGTAGATDFRLEQGTTHQIVMDGAMMSGFLLLPSQVKAQGFTSVTTLVPSTAQQVVFQIDASASPTRPSTVPAADVSLAVTGSTSFIEWYDPHTMLVDEVDVPAQQVVISRTKT